MDTQEGEKSVGSSSHWKQVTGLQGERGLGGISAWDMEGRGLSREGAAHRVSVWRNFDCTASGQLLAQAENKALGF